MMRNFPQLASVVQHNCDVSDARHAGDYGMCSFLLKMREYYRWEHQLSFSSASCQVSGTISSKDE